MALPLKDWLYIAALLIVSGALVWWRHSGVLEGEAKVRAAEVKAAQMQAQKDAETDKGVIDGLNADLQQLRKDALQPVTPTAVRLCRSVPAVQAQPTPAGDLATAAPTWGVPGVREGTGAGPDIGPGLRKLARSAELIGTWDRACATWALRSSQ